MFQVQEIVEKQKEFFQRQETRDIAFRIQYLKQLKNTIKEMEEEICQALHLDLRKARQESYLTEIGMVYSAIDLMIKKTKKWSKAKRKHTPLYLWGKSYVEYEPYGTVLVIAPFNYPFLLAIEPLVGALAAGNTVVVKPSELTPHTEKVIGKLIEKTFPRDLVASIEGEVETTTQLLKQKFDYIFFTGSPQVGKVVMKAAAENLIPISLELGGKSPTLVDMSADIKVAARRIIWGKLLNNGQTCIAPDYILVDSNVKAQLIEEMKESIKGFYGLDCKESGDYGRIINDKHFLRLSSILEKDKEFIIYGGQVDEKEKYIAPTLIEGSNTSLAAMEEEIFGPILPIIEFSDLEEAIQIIKTYENPLALYIFSHRKENISKLKEAVLSGNISINDTLKHTSNPFLPFGGVGNSGIGSYHGKYSFETFSHKRGVYENTLKFNVEAIFPPYSEGKMSLLKKFF